MAQRLASSMFLLILAHLNLHISGVYTTTFTIVNKCDHTIWPGILSNAGVPPLTPTGFILQPGHSKTIAAPTSWGGRFWARTLCTTTTQPAETFTCLTGDCASNKLECSGNGATPPATLAEFTLNGHAGLDFFDVSLVDGYNLPVLVVPYGGTGQNCSTIGCLSDLNAKCPTELKVTDHETVVACRSACEAFRSGEYCCSGAHGSPDTCKPSSYSKVFNSACPSAYSYAYDDLTSTFTCASADDYSIVFCPSSNTSRKSSQDAAQENASSSPFINSTMVYEGAGDHNDVSASSLVHASQILALACLVAGAYGLLAAY